MSHITTLVVDFDDTIAITKNRDWENAEPNQPLINRLNQLSEDGWTVHIVTARGSISCKTREDAKEKYSQQIKCWLENHDVCYDSLSFEKKLAAYYIDDKGITPEQFVEDFDRTPLEGGWSGATIYYDKVTNSVFKTADDSLSAVAWYEKANDGGYSVPNIESIVGNTIRMEFLKPYTGKIPLIVSAIESFATMLPLYKSDEGADADAYATRCTRRLKDATQFGTNTIADVKLLLEDVMQFTPETFGHGDCSISNILGDKDTQAHPAFIDPINDETLYSSWVIDIGKLYASLEIFQEHDFISKQKDILNSTSLPSYIVKVHALGHLCRVYPYAPPSERLRISKLITQQTNALRQERTSK